MGLGELLTKPIELGSREFRWREPMLYRIRLRGDLLYRIAVLFASCVAATGMLLSLFAVNADRPRWPLAIALGAGFGLAPAFLLCFRRRDHVSGTVWIYDDHILLQKVSAGFVGLSHNWIEWPHSGIDQCSIVSGKKIGQPFHVMLIKCEGDREMVGIPPSTELKKQENPNASFNTRRGNGGLFRCHRVFDGRVNGS